MDKALKTNWVKALCSGKYKQGKHSLKRGSKYCCLGVLGELMGMEEKNLVSKAWISTKKMSFTKQEKLANLNDSGVPFEMIAGFINENM